MWNDEKVASSQMMFLLVTTVSATGFLYVPAITAEIASRDGWLSVLVGATAFGILVALICTALGGLFPTQSVVEYAPLLLGKWLGKLVGLLYIFFFIHVNAIIVREFGDFLVSAFLAETPMLFFNLVVVALAASITRNGMEVLARLNQFIFPLFLGVLAFIVVLVIDEMSLDRLLPLMENGIKPVLAGSLVPSAWRGEIVLILMFLPFLNRPREARKSVITAVLLIAVLLTLPTLAGLMLFGAQFSARSVFPTLLVARYISLGGFLERVEAVIIIIWVAGITVKVAAFLLASSLAAAQWLGLKDYRSVVTPVGIITLVYSVTLFEDARELVHFLGKTWPPYAYVFELLLPLFLLVIAFIREKGGTPG